jgi:hypothetical protein
MNYTKEQIEKMADEYANQFMDGRDHFYGFKAGFEKALSLFAVSGRSELLLAFAKFIDADCDLLGDGYIEEMVKKFEASNSH